MIRTSLFDTLLEPCFVLNQEHNIIYCNETAAILCGSTIRRLQKMKFEQALEFKESIDWLLNLDQVREPTPYKEIYYRNKEGVEGRVQITCQILDDLEGSPLSWLIFVRDVTLEDRLQQKYRGELEQKEGYILELQKAQSELEKYSKNLEKMVEERTAQISKLNQLMTALLDSLSQGFFIFNKDGVCLDFSSRACLKTIEQDPKGKLIWEVLGLPQARHEGFRKWMFTLFTEMLPFEDIAPLGPQEYPHSQGNSIAIEYFPLRGPDQAIEGVVVVSSDISSLVEARKQAEKERQYAKFIVGLIQTKRELTRFVSEAEVMLKNLHEIQIQDPTNWNFSEIFRILHTLKGGASSFSIQEMTEHCHHAESFLTKLKEDPVGYRLEFNTIAKDIEKSFLNAKIRAQEILGEQAFSSEKLLHIPMSDLQALSSKILALPGGKAVTDIIEHKYFLEPIGEFFKPYDQMIQKIAANEAKSLKPLLINNGDIPVAGDYYAQLFACMVHAFRNAVDHGIETPQIRAERQKDPNGQIGVEFFVEHSTAGSWLYVKIFDDGEGIDPQKIRNKLDKLKIPYDKESDHDIIQHVFDSEFSTKEIVTDLSGRGVGMDAIRASAEKMGGQCWVESDLGHGTQLFVRVPLIESISTLEVAS